jgi:propionyl-CoA carboxylase alpha chain
VGTIRTILVANRGEIAQRLLNLASDLGIRSIAVYSDPDRGAEHTLAADLAVALPGTTATETYLDGERIIAAALAHGADAIHPGYGFLSENPDFAAAVVDAGLTWVGPNPESMRRIGDKLAAKRVAAEIGIPMLPSAEIRGEAPFEWRAQAAGVGYPLLVKAAAGGGGRGMRLVMTEDDLEDAVVTARREAESGFGDPSVFVERWLASPRHVEIQVIADKHGSVIHAGERECSVQRRHQKLIEEAPSPAIDDLQRDQLGLAAVRLAETIGYDSVGTVEFLLDIDSGGAYFLEMNTRLQVEYRVTELVTGLDLALTQLRIAEGEPLPFTQDEIELDGHAIEVRLVAEDPPAGWLPATGRLRRFWAPDHPGVLCDHALRDGVVITADYDSLLAKVVAVGATRQQAAGTLASYLTRMHLHGVTTNRDHLVAVLGSEDFLDGRTTTAFLDLNLTLLDARPDGAALDTHLVGAALWTQHRNRMLDPHWMHAPSGWRNVASSPQQVEFEAFGDAYLVRYTVAPDRSFTASVDERSFSGRLLEVDDTAVQIEIGGKADVCWFHLDDDIVFVNSGAGQTDLRLLPRWPERAGAELSHGPTAPVPGRIVAVEVSVGEAVTAGQTLVVMEAMKVEHRIGAAADGTVAEILVAPGDNVDAHQPLVRLEDLP